MYFLIFNWDFLKSSWCCNCRLAQPAFQFCTSKHSEKRTRTCCKVNSVPRYSLLPSLWRHSLFPSSGLSAAPLSPLSASFSGPAYTFRFLRRGSVRDISNERPLLEYQVIFLAREAIAGWGQEVSADKEVLNVCSAFLFSYCDPFGTPLSALSDHFSLKTFSTVTARTCLDERLSGFLVCHVNTLGLAN